MHGAAARGAGSSVHEATCGGNAREIAIVPTPDLDRAIGGSREELFSLVANIERRDGVGVTGELGHLLRQLGGIARSALAAPAAATLAPAIIPPPSTSS